MFRNFYNLKKLDTQLLKVTLIFGLSLRNMKISCLKLFKI